MEDLIAAGNEGLLRAARKFDPTKGASMRTYASFWIRSFITNYVIQQSNPLGTNSGIYRSKYYYSIRRAVALLETQGLSEGEALDRVAEQYNLEPTIVYTLLNRRTIRLDDHDSEEHKAFELVDDLDAESLCDDMEQDLRVKEKVNAAIDSITDPRIKRILSQRFLASEVRSLKSLADEYGLSRERIRQLEAKGLRKIWLYLECKDPRKEDVDVLAEAS